MKTFLIAFALIVLIAGFAIFGWMLSQPGPVNDRVKSQVQAGASKPAAGASATASTVRQQLPPPANGLPSLTPMAELSAPLNGNPAPVSGNGAAPDPVRDMMTKQVQVEIKARYAEILSQFKLSPEQQDKLTKILAERSMPGAEPAPDATSEDPAGEVSPARKASDEALRGLFGNEAEYQKFLKLEDTLSERMQLKRMGGLSQFESAGAPLTMEQQEWLYAVMASTARSAAARGPQGESVVEDGVAGLVNRNEQLLQAIARQAEGILTPAQIGVLKQMHAKTITEVKRGLTTLQSSQTP